MRLDTLSILLIECRQKVLIWRITIKLLNPKSKMCSLCMYSADPSGVERVGENDWYQLSAFRLSKSPISNHQNIRLSKMPGPSPRNKPNRQRPTANGHKLWPKPWPKILNIRGCAWGKPAGREQTGNPGIGTLNFF